MTRTILRVFIALLLPIALLCACSGGGGGGGISGSGVTIGTITGFGSVIVNGIEFGRRPDLPDSQARFRFDDTARAENELKVGMIVTVRGNFDSGAGKGVYESIEYHPEMRGPIDADGVNTTARTLSVLGRTIRVDASTIFDGFVDLAELQANSLVEVSGNLDNTGAFTATRIERKGTSFTPGDVVELKGTISSVGAGTFSIGRQVVNFDPALPGLFVDMTATDVTPATLVEVRGPLGADGVITANRIERQLAAGDAHLNDTVRIEGKVLSAGSASFQLSGPNGPLTVLTGNAAFLGGTPAGLVAGARVEVEGTLSEGGALAASKISFEAENTVKLEGNVIQAADVDPANGTIRLNGVSVSTGSQTRFRDNRTVPAGPSATFGLSEIAPKDHLQIVGFVDASGKIIATQLQRFNDSDRTFVQGRVDAIAAPNLTVLNIAVVTGTGTAFKDALNNTITRDAFFAALHPDTTVVKASGTFVPPGTIDPATEVEIEH